MSDRIIRRLATAARRTSAGYVLALGASIAAACTWCALAAHAQAAGKRAASRVVASAWPDVEGLDAGGTKRRRSQP